ncbi:hypothetical protein ABIA31_001720 [Catenulispora sp. MAP5-51]|uniref:hypothetical protein n=1 Tax=Catenulispora sp. MAP5-51 TaxID=3156298 RepID=UPI00351827F5
MNRRRLAIGVSSVSGLAVVAVGAMGMFGSGGSANAVDLHAAPVAAITGAAGATVQAGTAQTDTVVTVDNPAVPAYGSTAATAAQTLTMHGSGLFDFGTERGSVDLTLPTGALNEVMTPGTVWVRRPAAAATPTAAAVPASVWSPTSTGKVSDGNLISGGSTDPSLIIAMLRGVQPGVQQVGQDVVRGVPVAHYQGTLDLGQAAAALSGPASARDAEASYAAADKQALTNASRAFTTTSVPFDAYLDAQGRLRRFVATFAFVEVGPTKPVAHVTSATELFGFGTPVSITVPTVAPSVRPAPSAAPRTPGRRATTPSAHPTSPTRSHK